MAAVALLMCAILVGAGIQHRGGFKGNARNVVIWIAIIIGVAVLFSWLGWR